MAVIAHEVGHIKCGHVLYKMMARWIKSLLEFLSGVTLGIGGLVGVGIEVALLAWDRRTELSSDRASLLVMQDARLLVTLMMKLAGGTRKHLDWLDPEQFLNQARTYKEGLDQSSLDRFYRFIATYGLTHPFPAERARAIDEWANSPEYNSILSGDYSVVSQIAKKNNCCPKCGDAAENGAKFCSSCATPLINH